MSTLAALLREYMEGVSTLRGYENALRDLDPGLTALIDAERAACELRLNQVREAMKDSTESSVTVPGHGTARIVRKSTTRVDTAGLVSHATEARDLRALLDAGVLTYEVDPTKLESLPGTLRDTYKAFVRRESASPALHLPQEYKL